MKSKRRLHRNKYKKTRNKRSKKSKRIKRYLKRTVTKTKKGGIRFLPRRILEADFDAYFTQREVDLSELKRGITQQIDKLKNQIFLKSSATNL